MSDTPNSIRIKCGGDHGGRYTILDETTERWETTARGTAIVRTCESERQLRKAAVELVERADEEGPLGADEIAAALSTGLFKIEYRTDVSAGPE
jgi:hypothetical protein